MKIVFEIGIGVFAGYCCSYFITDKLMGMTPGEVIEELLNTLSTKQTKGEQ